jgi:hypothetical protein
MPPTPRKPLATEKKTNAVTSVEPDEKTNDPEDDNEARGDRDLHTRVEELEARVSELEAGPRATEDPGLSRGIDQDAYDRDDAGNVVNDGDLAISVDATGNVVRDPNQR